MLSYEDIFTFSSLNKNVISSSEKRLFNNETGHIDYVEHETVSYFWWYHLIGLIWTSEFIIACQQLVVSGTVATWYFSRLVILNSWLDKINLQFWQT